MGRPRPEAVAIGKNHETGRASRKLAVLIARAGAGGPRRRYI